MSAELERLRQDYAKFQAKVKRQEDPMEKLGKLQEQLAALEVATTSPGGKVTIVTGPGGAFRDIQLTEAAVQQPAAALAAEVKATLQQAVAQAARKQARVVDEAMGGQLNAYDQVLANQAEALGTTVDELNTAAEQVPAVKAPPKPPRNEDDFSENTLMSKGHKPPPPIPSSAPPPAESGSPSNKFLKNLFSEDEK